MRVAWFFEIFFVGMVLGCSSSSESIKTPTGEHSYRLSGVAGTTPVILEAGLGDEKESWNGVFSDIAKTNLVLAYDRAGYGGSESKNNTRDAKNTVAELRGLLQLLGLKPPYILVGHSLGGAYMEYFARNYPKEVAGLILVDSRSVYFDERCEVYGGSFCEPPEALKQLYSELNDWDKTISEVKNSPPFPQIPLSVLTGLNKPIEGGKFVKAWRETQEELATLSSVSEHSICESCGHYVHHEKPKLLLDALAWINAVLSKTPPKNLFL